MNLTTSAADGSIINIETFGKEDCPKLLLSNSLGTDISMWKKQVESLAHEFHIACYDTRGHGKTKSASGEYTIELLGNDALAVADALGWENFHFAGVSMGAMTGFWLAINAPERVTKVIAASGGPVAGGPDVWKARMASIEKDGLAPIAESLGRWFSEPFAENNAELLAELKAAHDLCTKEGYLGCCAALRDMDLRPGLASISIPMLVLAGEFDKTPPPSVLKMASDAVPNGQFATLPAGHLSNVEAPEEFDAQLRSFFAA